MEKIKEIWNNTVANLEPSLGRSGLEFLNGASPVSYNDAVLLIGCPDDFSKNWLQEKCSGILKGAFEEELGETISVVFEVTDYPEKTIEKSTRADSGRVKKEVGSNNNNGRGGLNPKYSFTSFVVGHGNRFAHAAALAVSESPAKAYNPLFIYGGVGLGKTHLTQAIGHFVLDKDSSAAVIYVSSEQFTNELINAIKDDRTELFRTKYRNIDVLLVDDIQFLAGKERTQEEFFHTFNALYEANKQIVVTSDRTPKEIPTLEDRLRSRFEWGLIADIQPPDLETRIAILKKKLEAENPKVLERIDSEILHFIASKTPSNIRELEGALTRIIASIALNPSINLTMDQAEDVLKHIVSQKLEKSKIVSIISIKKEVASRFNVSVDDLSAKIRTKEIAFARQVAMYLARELTNASLPKIGESFGGRDHTTVMYACEKVKEELVNDQNLVLLLKEIEKAISKQ